MRTNLVAQLRRWQARPDQQACCFDDNTQLQPVLHIRCLACLANFHNLSTPLQSCLPARIHTLARKLSMVPVHAVSTAHRTEQLTADSSRNERNGGLAVGHPSIPRTVKQTVTAKIAWACSWTGLGVGVISEVESKLAGLRSSKLTNVRNSCRSVDVRARPGRSVDT